MRSRRQQLSSDDGISIIEVVLAIVLGLIILMAALSTLDSTTRNEAHQQAKQDELYALRQSMTRLSKDIRQAVTVNPASTRSRLTMRTIILGDEANMTIELNGSRELLRVINGVPPGLPLATNVTNGATMFCFDPPTCTQATAGAAPFTRIRLTLVGVPEIGPQVPITLATDIELRNIK